MNRASAEAITVAFANTAPSDTRASVAWNVERSASTSRANCFGMLSREAGHSRVPVPPHRIIGWMDARPSYMHSIPLGRGILSKPDVPAGGNSPDQIVGHMRVTSLTLGMVGSRPALQNLTDELADLL
ncbi:hypothetical protein GOFOIKOB_6549 [Methylobacterium tardum]|nr:hypothetical protein GOFOIKOB_6549 [Methylobacterium tardum]